MAPLSSRRARNGPANVTVARSTLGSKSQGHDTDHGHLKRSHPPNITLHLGVRRNQQAAASMIKSVE